MAYFREDMQVIHPIEDGLVQDWDALEAVWDNALEEHLKIDTRETPILLSEKPYNPATLRYKYVSKDYSLLDSLIFLLHYS